MSPKTPTTQRGTLLLTLVLASSISPLALNIIAPSMASISRDLVVDDKAIGLCISAYLISMVPIQLISGPLSDRIGRRPVMLAAFTLFLFGTIICLLADTFTTLVIGRSIQAASAIGIVLSRAVVHEMFGRHNGASKIGYITMGMAIAPMIGPAIGGYADMIFGWRSIFWLLGLAGALAFLLAFFELKETNQFRNEPIEAQLANYFFLLRSGSFWAYAAASGLISGVFYAFIGGAPLLTAANLNMSSASYGAWFSLCIIGYISGNFLSGRYSGHFDIKTMMVTGGTVSTAAALVSAVSIEGLGLSAPALFGPMLVFGVGQGLVLPSAVVGSIGVEPKAAGAAAGLMGATQFAIGAITSSVAASIVSADVTWPFSFLLLGLAVAGLGFACLTKRE